MAGPNADFWQRKFVAGETAWDRGAPNPQLACWIGDGTLAPGRVLVPGCGAGREVAELARRGFEVTGLDYAPAAIERAGALVAELPPDARARVTLVQADATTWACAEPFDAIWEQACLCALYPDLWVAYGAQLHRWLRPGGALFALFVQALRPGASQGLIEGPPYHCDVHAMRALLPASRWQWPKPPYRRIDHPNGLFGELALVLRSLPAAD